MSSRIAAIAIDAVQPPTVAEFWCGVLGWEVLEVDVDGDYTIHTIGPSDTVSPRIDVLGVPEGKSVKNRLHLDLQADDASTETELQRLFELGARRVDVGQDTDVSWVVLADPEGNEFCLLSHTVEEEHAE